MHTYTVKGEPGVLPEDAPRNFTVLNDEVAIVRLASILGVRPEKKGQQPFKRRNRYKIFHHLARKILMKYGKISMYRGSSKVFPRHKHRTPEPKANGIVRKRRPVQHIWLEAA